MSEIIESIDVDVPVRTAYDQWTQFESFPDFLDEVESITQLDDTRLHWVVEIGGQTREFDAEITEQHPDDRVAWRSTTGEVRQAGVVTFHRLSDRSCRVTAQISWEPEGALETAASVVGLDGHAVRKDLGNFKKFVEERGTATGQWRGDVDASL